MHRYRTHTCGALLRNRRRQCGRLSGWCHRISRPWRPCCSSISRPLRHHPGCWWPIPTRRRSKRRTLRSEWVCGSNWQGCATSAGNRNSELPTGAIEVLYQRHRSARPAGELPMPGVSASRQDSGRESAKYPLSSIFSRAPASPDIMCVAR